MLSIFTVVRSFILLLLLFFFVFFFLLGVAIFYTRIIKHVLGRIVAEIEEAARAAIKLAAPHGLV